MTLQERIAEVLKLEAEATPAPWVTHMSGGDGPPRPLSVARFNQEAHDYWQPRNAGSTFWHDAIVNGWMSKKEDCDFIVAAHAIIPDLAAACEVALTALEASHRERDKLRSQVEAVREFCQRRMGSEDMAELEKILTGGITK